ncbi:hypothetical protein D6D12_00764 [Aureobasidium pullulans]|uniref:BTB domain-containing protein n=1 Tax=Aureobasidium pullulans TaxID=5580 RepID=A0AB74K8K2_AURPU|nr:hypothetical protein D6D12_00764 [Aureobasidium pullulans]
MPQPTCDTAAAWSLRITTKILGRTTGIIKVRSTDEDENDDEAFKGVIHKTLLCCYSKYYRAALQGAFAEASSRSIVLDLDPVSCNTLIGWLYSGKLPTGGRREQFFALYIFAGKTDMLVLRRAIMTRVVGTKSDGLALPSFEKAALALNSLPQTSPLYRWLLDTYIHDWLPEYKAPEDVLPNGFLVDWLTSLSDHVTLDNVAGSLPGKSVDPKGNRYED